MILLEYSKGFFHVLHSEPSTPYRCRNYTKGTVNDRGAGLLSLTLPQIMQAEQKQLADQFQGGRAKSVIFYLVATGASSFRL